MFLTREWSFCRCTLGCNANGLNTSESWIVTLSLSVSEVLAMCRYTNSITLSVKPSSSLCSSLHLPVVPCIWFFEIGKLYLVETQCWTWVTGEAHLGSNVKVVENEKVKIVFHACLCQNWIGLFQTKTKMITSQLYTSLSTFYQRKCLVLWLSVT